MEVHSHTHSPRKKWNHYFWEFIMLFLAVFCGFLAENKREHMVEHRREKEYMRSFMEDLIVDTSGFQRSIRLADSTAIYGDSTVMFLTQNKITDSISVRFTQVFTMALVRLRLIFTDRTSSQLKNSGSMR